GENGIWAWPGQAIEAEPKFWACVAKRLIVSLSEGQDFECSLSEIFGR
ncbi:hypothetical protein A2U01_0057611, partial [Trifolium medium]|nr:hypothetical protein [Trifolium medium]